MKSEIIQILNKLSKDINKHYGYVNIEGSNFNITELRDLIEQYLDEASKYV